MDKLGEALVILTSKAEENDTTVCTAYTSYSEDCMVDEYLKTREPYLCTNCIYNNHRLLDKPIQILNKLGE